MDDNASPQIAGTFQPLGKVYLVGAGPGDPGLITLRGKKLLQKADVVVYDYLANPRLLRFAREDAVLIYAGKKGGGLHAYTQQGINRLLVEHARAGKMVVRLKGGDPFIFGRGGEEIEELAKEGIDFEAVPGVTAASAAATCTGIPITHREYTASVAFITGHEDPAKAASNIHWRELAEGVGTLVIYMGIKNLPDIVKQLTAAGRQPSTPVAVVRWASTPWQESVVGTLDNIVALTRDAAIKPPALIIVGEVVQARGAINWFERRPLFGRRIVITRTREQASELTALLEEMGADCLECPTIKISALPDYSAFDATLAQMAGTACFDWLLLTSPNAVRYFFSRLHAHGLDSRALAGLKIGVVGQATEAALAQHGLQADFLPPAFTGEGLAEALIARGEAQNKRFFLPQALKAGNMLSEKLLAAGAQVTAAPVYQNEPDSSCGQRLRDELAAKAIDLLAFASSSAARNCFTMLAANGKAHLKPAELQALVGQTRIAAIGPQTAATVQEYGFTVHIQPKRHLIPDLAGAIAAFYQIEKKRPLANR